MSPSKKFLYFSVSFIFGVFLSAFFVGFKPLSAVFLILGIILTASFFSRKKVLFFGICLIFLGLGMFRQEYIFNWPKTNLKITNDFFSGINFLKNRLEDSVNKNFSFEQAQILDGIIFGDNGAVSWEMKNKLNISGLRYAIVVSGFHVAIFGGILMSLFLGLGLWKKQAILFSLFFLFIYLAMTGFHPSAVRAGIMGGAFFIGKLFGRKALSFRFLVFSAAIMLAFSPDLLKNDLGFSLSFTATAGIILLSAYFSGLFSFFPKKLSFLRDMLAITFAAQIFSLPIMIFSLGQVSLAAPISNILASPTIYWIMILGFISAFFGLFLGFLGKILSFPCQIFLNYFLWVVNAFSAPFFQKSFHLLHWFWLIFFYVILGYLAYLVKEKEKLKFLK